MSDNNSGRDAVVTTGGWFVFMILLAIPVVNIIVIIVEAFGSGSNRNKQGYCRALIIWFILNLIGVGLMYGLFFGVLKAASEKFDENVGSEQSVADIFKSIEEEGEKILLKEGDNSFLKNVKREPTGETGVTDNDMTE